MFEKTKEVKETIEFLTENDECVGFCKLLSKVNDKVINLGHNRYSVTKSQLKELRDANIGFRIVFEN